MAEVVTGEAVVVDIPCARFPSRLLALAIDLATQLVLLAVMFLLLAAAAAGPLNPAYAAALGLTTLVLVIVGYPVIWESVSRGRSPGKFALGLRVVSDDGGPERFRQALVRGLSAAVEIWLLWGIPALLSSLLSARGKRLGDLFAGTFVIQQRLPSRRGVIAPAAVIAPALAAWAAGLELSGLTDQTAELARGYLSRLGELTPDARTHLGTGIAGALAAQVSPPPPPGTPVTEYLGAVLAERRRREQSRLMPASQPGHSGQPGSTAAGPPAPSPQGSAGGESGLGAGQGTGTGRRAGGFAPPA